MSRLTILGKLTRWMVYIPALDTVRLNTFTWLSRLGMSFMDGSYRITRIISPGAQDFITSTAMLRPAIYAVYHGRMVGLLGLAPREKLTVLISDSRDGEIIARALLAMGFSVARGSIKRKAVQGAKALVDAARAGQSIAFMVDGPRGPIYDIKPGIIRLAELTQLPIIPFVCQSRSHWWFPSWDKFMGPLWGTPIIYMFADPIKVPRAASDDERAMLLCQLQSTMSNMANQTCCFWDNGQTVS